MIMDLYGFISFGFGFLVGCLLFISLTPKKRANSEKLGVNSDVNKEPKVKVKITYDYIIDLYFVYYNGECQKAFHSLEEAKFWAESNIDKYLKGIEVKYEKEY